MRCWRTRSWRPAPWRWSASRWPSAASPSRAPRCWTAWTLTVAQAFEAALRALRDAGARIEEIALDEIHDLGDPPGHRRLLRGRELRLAPRAAAAARRRLRPARAHPHRARRRHEGLGVPGSGTPSRRVDRAASKRPWQGFDAVLSPTVPIVAPADRGTRARRRARRGLLPQQRAPAAQHQRGQHAGRLRAVAALPRSAAACRSG